MAASHNRPSAKLCPKTIDLFSTSNSTSNSPFLNAFTSGRIPCRLVHGSVRNRLAWNTSIDDLNYDPVLVLLAEGLRETAHPLPFISRQGFTELMSNINARQKVIPILPKLINPIKLALSSNDDEVFEGALNALIQLSTVVGNELDKYLKTYLSILAKRMSNRKYRDSVTNALNIFEENGEKDILPVIKSKIPTYCSVHI
ncbi:unnamed protein product [Rotaria sordida]|uniref:PACRG-like protein n=1 Tax=Rotaria sordida TaxID=392033 RepID=A0A814QXN5_9BILA|nr:unnamed protein product [Rotaria sordida]CAF1126287.1 unnamed protein product [Rotaria sordida]CAF4105553.1 unnamed protein product [Rotaria sordida]